MNNDVFFILAHSENPLYLIHVNTFELLTKMLTDTVLLSKSCHTDGSLATYVRSGNLYMHTT